MTSSNRYVSGLSNDEFSFLFLLVQKSRRKQTGTFYDSLCIMIIIYNKIGDKQTV